MTLKYESELLFDLMKRDGDDAPSDVLPYESELKEKYLNQVVGAYPKLQDYRPEWLNYNLYHHLPSDFPVESVANVTSASFNNVVPYAYKSAILTGQTLVNLHPDSYGIGDSGNSTFYIKKKIDISLIKPNTKYFIRLYNTHEKINKVYFKPCNKDTIYFDDINNKYTIHTTKSDLSNYNNADFIHFYANSSDNLTVDDVINTKIVFCEYQEGMENWDIPYFEGMQSVQMPVLTTTGKNLFDNKILTNYIMGEKDGGYIIDCYKLYQQPYILEKPLTGTFTFTYTSKEEVGENNPRFLFYFNDGTTLESYNGQTSKEYETYSITINNKSITKIGATFSKLNNIKWIIKKDSIQLEQGSTATTYEPYKSNILTVNEPVELRGIGDVQDTLDLLTGEVVQNIGEMVLDGSEDGWTMNNTMVEEGFVRFYGNPINGMKTDSYLICDKLPQSIKKYGNGDAFECVAGRNNNSRINVKLKLETLGLVDNTVNNNSIAIFKSWLKNNNLKIKFELATESVKTVDLSCINEQGESETFRPIEGTMHVNTSSQTLKPLLDMSVPVEATTQNLMSFANIVEEE